jgi:superfamily I DNA/RNA helicase
VPPQLAGLAASLVAWAAPYPDVAALEAAIDAARARRAELRAEPPRLTLATAHGTKGLEFDEVACVGLDLDRFPSARTLTEAADPTRALEEERRLAYVAWTRARRRLLLVYDPGAPSPFMREAFDDAELAPPRRVASGRGNRTRMRTSNGSWTHDTHDPRSPAH